MRVYTHPACLRHAPGSGHPEAPARLEAVLDALRSGCPELDWHEAPEASREHLARVHTARLIAQVLDEPTTAPRNLDEDTVMSTDSAAAALRAAGAVVAAVDAVVGGETAMAFCAVRPPGHHADADTAMGFCLFNAIAVAAAHALAVHGLQRIAIVDFDVHHGNGTQAIFAAEPRVLHISSHQLPLYPQTGYPAERGVGNLINAPLSPGAGGLEFRDLWRERLLPALDAFAPQLLLISAGFDAHRLDPLADLNLGAEDYAWISRELADIARKHAGSRVVSTLEGGYSLAALRESVVAHVRGLSST